MSKDLQGNVATDGAGAIPWQPWGEAAFGRAAATGRPILLDVGAPWCEVSRRMRTDVYADPEVRRVIAAGFVAVRVDGDREPHIRDRYMAGWPTTAFLTPTGEVLWSGGELGSAELLQVASGVLHAWRERRPELEREIGRRTWALEASRGQVASGGLVRREPAEQVLAAARAAFDPRHGGFGTAPKLPEPDVIELLYVRGSADAQWSAMADQTLDGMLAGGLWDAVDGGFFRGAHGADWSGPMSEKLLDVNAGLLQAYTLGSQVRKRPEWRAVVERVVHWADAVLAGPHGLWGGSQAADSAFYAASATARAALPAPAVDTTLFTTVNARWIAALAGAGSRLGETGWIARAELAMRTLLPLMAAPGGGLYHFRATDDEAQNDFLLADAVAVARASLALAQATGRWEWTETTCRLARHMEAAYWAEEGGFHDRVRTPGDVGTLRYLDCPFETNAEAARVLLDLAHVTGERHWRALAERTLARLAPLAGRFGVAAATFALATDEFFDPPPAVFIAVPADGDEAAQLRAAALALPIPALRVWSVPAGHRSGPEQFTAGDVPLAYLLTRRGRSAAMAAPAEVADVAAAAGVRS